MTRDYEAEAHACLASVRLGAISFDEWRAVAAALRTAHEAGRREGAEMAAQVCDATLAAHEGCGYHRPTRDALTECAATIRLLLDDEAPRE